MTPNDLIDDLRSRINPAYAATLGTESYERSLCAETLEGLIAEQEELRDEVARLRTQRDYLMSSVRRTLKENGHLADGDNCTLLVLKRAVKTLEEVGAGDHDYYPAAVCSSCGAKYGRRRCGVATWHAGKCGICGIDSDVTDPRDFGHLHSDWRDRHKKGGA